MNGITLLGILFLIIYALKKDKKHEKFKASENFERYANDEWEEWFPEASDSTPEKPFSIEILSYKNHPVMQGMEAFSIN